MNVLSLFDGISCGRVALERAGINVEKYYASEIDKYAISISQKNYPDIKQVGSVVDIKSEDYKDIDLLIGGSPCQDLSIAKKGREGLRGSRSGLFYEYLRILKEVKPKYFILENVNSMPKEAKETITKELFGIEPIMINAALVSAQNRKRLFWVGKLVGDTYEKVDINLPDNKNLFLKDIITGQGKDITERMNKKVEGTLAYKKTWGNIRTLNQKSKTLTAGGQSICNSGATNVKYDDGSYHQLTTIECERLQSLPDNYTEGVSNTQRYKALGNAFNVEVVAHILKNLK